LENGSHLYDRSLCVQCGSCVDECVYEALENTGRDINSADVVREVMKDLAFYQESGGGVTISGGEPLSQGKFVRALLTELKRHGVHTAVETSGFGARKTFAALLPVVDLFLFDIKAVEPQKHLQLTGVSNQRILSHLDYLLRHEASVELRCPLIPGINDSDADLAALAQLIAAHPSLTAVTLLPYHNTGNEKYTRYSLTNPLPGLKSADQPERDRWVAALAGCAEGKIRIS
jgi:pyruvate formate lyase activating enzyme